MEYRDLHQLVIFPTTALDLYQCILDERKHSSFTGSPAVISDKEGEVFTAYDGYITGKNVVLERGKKIIQLWRANEEDWPESHFSEVIFSLKDTDKGCELEFFHMGIPLSIAEDVEKGWEEYYWEPLRFYLER